jgi:hypothetical protein
MNINIAPRREASVGSDDTSGLNPTIAASIEKINDIITTDFGGRGMTHFVVDGDLRNAAKVLARLQTKQPSLLFPPAASIKPHVIFISGFPCCVNHYPPTETDGINGTFALASLAVLLGYRATICTEKCNEFVFRAAASASAKDSVLNTIDLVFVNEGVKYSTSDKECIYHLARSADLVIACERAGPAVDGNCYTMRGINMTENGFIAPLHMIVDIAREAGVKFIAIGDGGNELGMGKVLDKIRKEIPNGEKIGSIVRADYLIAASVSNWGAWALVAATALIRYNDRNDGKEDEIGREACIHRLCTTEEAEIEMLNRVVEKGCRDGVTGLLDATVDGIDIATNMMYFREIRKAALNI